MVLTSTRDFSRAVVRYVLAHPDNHAHPLPRLARAFGFQIAGRVFGRRKIVPIGDHCRMWADVHHGASFKAYCGNPPDWCQMTVWRRILGPGDLFIDVGANVGTYTLWAADLGAHVIAVEPNAEARAHLLENLRLNAVNVEVLPFALAGEAGAMLLTTHLDGANHLVISEDDASPSLEVQVSTLDHLIGTRTVAGVKIDVEGAELLVLEGARQALKEQRIACLQLEWGEAAATSLLGEGRRPVAALLQEYGYELRLADAQGNLRRDSDLGNATDVFALPVRA